MNTNYILEVAQCENITKAAEKLGISQPALSVHIRKIEEQLGIAIFDRSAKPLALTEAGKLYISYLKEKELLEKEFTKQMADLDDLKWGSLTLGGASFFNVSYFPKAVAEFSKKYPDIKIKIVDGAMPEITEKAQKHEIDLFLAPSWDMDDRFCYEQIVSEKIFLCVPESFQINEKLTQYRVPRDVVMLGETNLWIEAKKDRYQKPFVNFGKFKDEPFIRLGENQHIGNIMDQLFKRHGFAPKGCITVEQTMTSYGLTLAGAGISLITEGSVRNGHMEKYPAFYLIDEDLCQRDMYIAYSKQKYLSKAAKEFISILRKSL